MIVRSRNGKNNSWKKNRNKSIQNGRRFGDLYTHSYLPHLNHKHLYFNWFLTSRNGKNRSWKKAQILVRKRFGDLRISILLHTLATSAIGVCDWGVVSRNGYRSPNLLPFWILLFLCFFQLLFLPFLLLTIILE